MGRLGFISRAILRVALIGRSRRKRALFLQRELDKVSGQQSNDHLKNGERLVVRRFVEHLPPGKPVIFDVGANLGQWAVAIDELLEGRDAEIWSFEPSKETFEKLKATVETTETSSTIHAVHAAIGDEEGEGQLHLTAPLSGTNSMFKRVGTKLVYSDSESVSLRRGDTFCEEKGIEKIDFMKVDTEGYELKVLAGFERMLAKQAVGCIQFEYGGSWIDAHAFLMDAFAILKGHGYVVGKIFPRGLHIIGAYEQTLENFRLSNFLALREDWVKAFPLVK